MFDSFNWKWQLRGNCEEVSCTWGTEFSIGSCIPSKYMNQRKPSGSSFHQKSFPYWPNHFSLTIHLESHGLGLWVTKIIPDLARFFNGFLLEIWTYTLTFPYVSQGPLLKASKGHIKIRGPWCWFFLLHILWLDWDPSSYCMSSGLTEILFFFLYYYYYYYFFLFPSFWDFEPSWSFLTSWIEPSFVKAHGLSLHFMEWAIM